MSGVPQVPVLLYDGECGFCARSVQFVLRHEPPARRSQLAFAPLQGTLAARMFEEHPQALGVDSVVWYEPLAAGGSRVLLRSDAALAVLRHVGGGWRILAALGRLVPRVLRDAVYNAIARRRLDLAAPACLLPDESERRRFLP